MARRKAMASVVTAAALAVLAIGAGLAVAVGAGKAANPAAGGARRAGAAVSGPATFAGPDGREARWVIAENRRPGTTAWRISMYRRQVVESVNAALKGAFADISRGFFRVFGRAKITVLLGFTIAAYNLDRIRSFRAKQAEEEGQPRQRAKRRLGTWAELAAVPNDTIVDEREDRPD